MRGIEVTESILRIVLRHARLHGVSRIMTVRLRVGRLSELEAAWIQSYLDGLSAGTIAEGARIAVETIPVRLECLDCGTVCEAEIRVRLISGHEYRVESIEAV